MSALEKTSNCSAHVGFCSIKCHSNTPCLHTTEVLNDDDNRYSKIQQLQRDRLSRQTVLNFLVTCLLFSDYINLFYGKYVVMHFGLWYAGHTQNRGWQSGENGIYENQFLRAMLWLKKLSRLSDASRRECRGETRQDLSSAWDKAQGSTSSTFGILIFSTFYGIIHKGINKIESSFFLS